MQQAGGHLGFQIIMILAIFYLQAAPILPTKFLVNWPLGSGEEAQHGFSRWRLWRPSLNSDRNNFSNFLSTRRPDTSYQVSCPLAQGCRRSNLKQIVEGAGWKTD